MFDRAASLADSGEDSDEMDAPEAALQYGAGRMHFPYPRNDAEGMGFKQVRDENSQAVSAPNQIRISIWNLPFLHLQGSHLQGMSYTFRDHTFRDVPP